MRIWVPLEAYVVCITAECLETSSHDLFELSYLAW